MGKISLGGINKSLLYITLMSIFQVLNQYIYGFIYIECFYKMNIYQILYNAIIDPNKADFPHHRVFDPLFSYIGVIILSFCIKKEKNDEEVILRSQLELKLIHNETKSFLESQNCLLVFLKVIILWVAEENLLLIYVDIFQDLDFWFFELIFISLIFSKNFYFKIYSHQKLGMAISIGVGSILKVYNITLSILSSKKEEDKNFYQKYPSLCIFVLLYFILIFLRSYVNTQLKILMDLKFVTLRALLIFYGFIGFCMCLLAGIFTSCVPCFDFIYNYVCKIDYGDNMYYDHFLNYAESWKNFFVRLIPILLGAITFFLNKYYCTMIIKHYTPIHVIFSFPIQFFIEKTFLLIFTSIFFIDQLFSKENQAKKFLLDIFGDVASIIGFLIYLEMIELNFWGFNYNLKKNIINRGEDDYRISLTTNAKLREESLSSLSDISIED